MATQNWDWIFHPLGWTLAGSGLLLAFWALFWDCSRGRERCPKCWYSMAGAVESEGGAVTCPECGKEIRDPHVLSMTRRRKRWATLAFVLVVGSHFVWATPRIRSDGWPGAVPTTLIIAGFGFVAPPNPTRIDGQWDHPVLYSQRSDLIWAFGEDRIEEEELWSWQRDWLESKALRYMHDHYTGYSSSWSNLDYFLFDEREPDTTQLRQLRQEIVELSVLTRESWPANVPLRASLSLHHQAYSHDKVRIHFKPKDERIEPFVVIHQMYGSTYVENEETGKLDKSMGDGNQVELPHLPPRLDGLACRVTIEGDECEEENWTPVRTIEYTIPVRTTKLAQEIMTPARGEDAALAVTESDPPHLSTNHLGSMQLQWVPKIRPLRKSGSTIGVRIEVIGDGTVCYTTEKWWEVQEYDGWVLLRSFSDNYWLRPTYSGSKIDPTQIKDWSVRIVGDAEVALRNFDSDTYWNGEAVFPATFGEPQRRERQDFKSDPNAGPHPDAFVSGCGE